MTNTADYCNGLPDDRSISSLSVDPDRRWLHVQLPVGTEGWAAQGYFEHADPPFE